MEKEYQSFQGQSVKRTGPSLPKLSEDQAIKYPILYTNPTSDVFSLINKKYNGNRTNGVRIAKKNRLSSTFFSSNPVKFKKSDKIIYKVYSEQNKRNYNQDRFCCIPILQKPFIFNLTRHHNQWTDFGYYSIFDGHGGSKCAQFLCQNLNHYILRQKQLLQKPSKALQAAFRKIQKDFLDIAQNGQNIDTSGSCAIVCLLFQQKFYLANLGDSHCIIFRRKSSNQPEDINTDHKPNNKIEYTRIITNGGKVLRDEARKGLTSFNFNKPSRIYPGSLNVSRTFGDIQAKLKKYGGLPNVISSQPQIYEISTDGVEYIIIGSDGLFQGLSKYEIHNIYIDSSCQDADDFLDIFIKRVIKQASKTSNDNITVIVILLKW